MRLTTSQIETVMVFMAATVLMATLVVCQYSNSRPLEFQPSTLNVALTSCNHQTTINSTSSPFALCPTNTCHVVVNKSVSWLTAEDGSVWTANLSIGCCPNDTYGVYDSTDNRLYGCCGPPALPVSDDPTPVPCFNYQRQMIGCTNNASRCCGNRICGEHYVCCGGECCPEIAYNGLYILEDACNLVVTKDSLGNDVEYYSGCKKTPLFVCEPLITYAVTCPPYNASSEINSCPYCELGALNCIFPPPGAPFLQVPCGASGDCVKMNATIANCSGITSPCTDNVSVVDIPVGCTNKTHNENNTCIYSVDNPIPSLIGDRAADETCCGPFICSKNMKCCSQDVTNFLNSTGTNVTTTQFYGCCPDVPDIQCCYNNIVDPSDPRSARNFFCGAAYNSTPCSVDKTRPALFFAMAQLAKNLSGI